MGLHLLRNSETWSRQITKFRTWKTGWDVDTNAVILQDDFANWIQSYPMETKETSETMSCLQNFLFPSQKPERIYTHTQFQRVFLKPVKIDNGIITQAPLVPQKRREWQKEPFVQWKKEQRSHQCKVDCQKKGVTVRWNAIVTYATCTIKWPHGKTAFQERHGQQSDGPSLSGDDDSRLWWFARVRSLRHKRQNIQKRRTIRKRRLRTRPSSTADRNLDQKDDVEIEEGDKKGSNTRGSWSMSRIYISPPHEEVRLKLYDSDNGTFPIPLKYIDVMRQIQTTGLGLQDSGSYVQDFLKDPNVSMEDPRKSQILPYLTVNGVELGQYYPRNRINCRIGRRKCQTASSTPQRRNLRYIDRWHR